MNSIELYVVVVSYFGLKYAPVSYNELYQAELPTAGWVTHDKWCHNSPQWLITPSSPLIGPDTQLPAPDWSDHLQAHFQNNILLIDFITHPLHGSF